jgi:hypothetical protein
MIRLLLGIVLVISGFTWATVVSLRQASEEGLTLWQLIIGYHVREPFYVYAGPNFWAYLVCILLGAALTMSGYGALENLERTQAEQQRSLRTDMSRVLRLELGLNVAETMRLEEKLEREKFKPFKFKNPSVANITVLRDEAGMPYLAADDNDVATRALVERINTHLSALGA